MPIFGYVTSNKQGSTKEREDLVSDFPVKSPYFANSFQKVGRVESTGAHSGTPDRRQELQFSGLTILL